MAIVTDADALVARINLLMMRAGGPSAATSIELHCRCPQATHVTAASTEAREAQPHCSGHPPGHGFGRVPSSRNNGDSEQAPMHLIQPEPAHAPRFLRRSTLTGAGRHRPPCCLP